MEWAIVHMQNFRALNVCIKWYHFTKRSRRNRRVVAYRKQQRQDYLAAAILHAWQRRACRSQLANLKQALTKFSVESSQAEEKNAQHVAIQQQNIARLQKHVLSLSAENAKLLASMEEECGIISSGEF